KLGSYDSTNGIADVLYDNVIAWDVDTMPGLPDLVHGFGKGVFDHGTFGEIRSTGDVAGITNAFFNGYGGQRDEVKNSALVGIDGPLFSEFEALSYDAFENTQAFTPSGAEQLGDTFLSVAILTDALKYLPRIESGSALSGKASDGQDIGATVTTFRGRAGTLFGETGWDDETSLSMWPFPHEERIAKHMGAYTYSGNLQSGKAVQVSGARGFAEAKTALDGGPQTLTSYVWEYLGTPCPAEICRP
ncbi:MAG: hypothetical protein KC492_41410, partial [Myxococcales bacterium]|nr:hypothetical protein [Myxococcales bacterium]